MALIWNILFVKLENSVLFIIKNTISNRKKACEIVIYRYFLHLTRQVEVL